MFVRTIFYQIILKSENDLKKIMQHIQIPGRCVSYSTKQKWYIKPLNSYELFCRVKRKVNHWLENAKNLVHFIPNPVCKGHCDAIKSLNHISILSGWRTLRCNTVIISRPPTCPASGRPSGTTQSFHRLFSP